MKTISIIGATGSIGESTLKVVSNFKDKLKIKAVTTNCNIEKLKNIINNFDIEYAVCTDSKKFFEIFGKDKIEYNGVWIYSGDDYIEKVCSEKVDIVVNGVSGIAGLDYSIKVLKASNNLALANKESIVCAGNYLKELAKKNNCEIIPVDSEHSAIFFLLENKNKKYIEKLHLTASGGPFLNLDKSEWHKITLDDALKHPTWKMGKKISIDSATMANKGLEVIEAHYLFDFDYSKINVLVHPQSIIHSMVETIDGEIYAQLGPKDMSIPIQNAIFFPDMQRNCYNRIDWTNGLNLTLFNVDFEKYKMLYWAYYCGKKEGVYPAIFNILNDELVELFMKGKIRFVDIEILFEKIITKIENKEKVITKVENQNIGSDNFSIETLNELQKIIKDLIEIELLEWRFR